MYEDSRSRPRLLPNHLSSKCPCFVGQMPTPGPLAAALSMILSAFGDRMDVWSELFSSPVKEKIDAKLGHRDGLGHGDGPLHRFWKRLKVQNPKPPRWGISVPLTNRLGNVTLSSCEFEVWSCSLKQLHKYNLKWSSTLTAHAPTSRLKCQLNLFCSGILLKWQQRALLPRPSKKTATTTALRWRDSMFPTSRDAGSSPSSRFIPNSQVSRTLAFIVCVEAALLRFLLVDTIPALTAFNAKHFRCWTGWISGRGQVAEVDGPNGIELSANSATTWLLGTS